MWAWSPTDIFILKTFDRSIAIASNAFTSLRLTPDMFYLLGTMIINMTRCRVVTAPHPTVERMLSRLGRT